MKSNFRPLVILFLTFGFLISNSCFRGDSPNYLENTPTISPVFDFESIDDLYRFLTYEENSYPLISAHRGGPSEGYPENAIATFAQVAKKMPTIIECDISMTKDSVLVLMHDETLDRTSNGKGKLANFTFEQLQALRLKDINGKITKYNIPTLEQALEWGIGKVIFTLDVKKNVPYKKVIDIIRLTKTESNTIIITYNANQASVVNKIAPDLMISATIKHRDDLSRLNNLGIPDNRLIAFVGTSEPNTDLYTLLRKHGIKSILGTIGNLDRSAKKNGYQIYTEMIMRGADIISTDHPFMAYKAISYYVNKHNISSPYIL